MMDKLNFDTLAVRDGSLRTEFNEHSAALSLTSSFCSASAAEAVESSVTRVAFASSI